MSSEHNTPQVGTAEDVLEAATAEIEEQQEENYEAQPTSEYEQAEVEEQSVQEAPAVEVSLAPTMSPEETLLLQVLKRAKRQQDLILKVQKSLKVLANIEKTANRTSEQIKQLQSAAKESQRQVAKTQRQIAAVEKRVQKIAGKKAATSSSGKSKRKKKSSSKRR